MGTDLESIAMTITAASACTSNDTVRTGPGKEHSATGFLSPLKVAAISQHAKLLETVSEDAPEKRSSVNETKSCNRAAHVETDYRLRFKYLTVPAHWQISGKGFDL